MTVDVLKQIWPEWQIEEKPLGRGSFGIVYKAVRRDHNVESYAAIKAISIPNDPSEVASLRAEGLNKNASRTFLQGIVNDFVSEIQLMESLKGNQNIVSVEDYKVVEKKGEIGWDIYIRMELLTPFNNYICDKKMKEEDVIRLGCDICTALEVCGKLNVIHRDIKPENIFVHDFGHYKLGDFGIARKMENVTGGFSQKGTFNYMAPEVANSNDYDARVDVYSLGVVLYRLLNGNRLPFLDTEKQLLNPVERRNAVERRIRGEALPAPCDASPEMAQVILRACSFDPNMRFSSAAEMKQALLSVANGTYRKIEDSDLTKTIRVRKGPKADRAEEKAKVAAFDDVPKKRKLPRIIAAILAVAVLAGAGVFAGFKLMDGKDEENADEENSSVVSEVDTEENEESGVNGIEVVVQPQNVTAEVGEKASVEVQALGEGLTYQWWVSDVGDDIYYESSSTGPVYQIEMTDVRNGRHIYCVIRDAHGNCLMTDTAVMSQSKAFESDIEIVKQPEDVAVKMGEKASVEVEAVGEDLTYQWWVTDIGDDKYYESSITGPVYCNEMTDVRNGRRLYCVIRDANGNCIMTDTASMTMKDD